jgi:endoglucanase
MKYLIPLFILVNACSTNLPSFESAHSEAIRVNQIGYYPNAVKKAVLSDIKESSDFIVVDLDKMNVVFTDTLSNQVLWKLAGQQVKVADFSALNTPGNYAVFIPGTGYSYPFEIKKNVLHKALKASIKGLYYLRMSIPLEQKYAGQWTRQMAHPDTAILFHPSSGYESGSTSSPGGWYDAGDYNKYVVNGAFSVGQLLLLHEHAPELIEDNSLNIPESGNGKSDLLDELKYELDWLLTMQDLDGGCFHKVTAKNFEPMVMPDSANSQRFMVGKGTAATLDFAACMAKASHAFRNYDPKYADLLLASAKRAWKWALANPALAYRNPEDIQTGEYGDNNFDDEWVWASAELYAMTGKKEYLDRFQSIPEKHKFNAGESWTGFMRYLGYFALLDRAEGLPDYMRIRLSQGTKTEAQRIHKIIQSNDYFQPVKRFVWGSNSDLINAAMILAMAHRLDPDISYLNSIQQTVDYIFGKNAVGYSFLTGFGERPPLHIHHRQSAADNIIDPVPGLLSGGPNINRQDIDWVDSYPDNDYPMQSWADHVGSYASNEICLNWNAPLTYILGYLENQSNQ